MIEIANYHKRILYGQLYRPTNSDDNNYSHADDSFALDIDIEIADFIISGDLNLYVLSSHMSRKIEFLYLEFSLY